MIFIKYIIKRVLSLVLHIMWIFPVRRNKVLFINDHSYTYSDNLKYLAEYLAEHEPGKYDMYFSLKDRTGLKDKRIKPVRFMSPKHFYHVITAGTVITNNSGIMYFPIRKQQLVINTWHGGGPYKVTGVGNINTYWYRKDLKYNASKTNYILSDSKVFTEQEARGLFYTRRQCISCGMPRMDLLFDAAAIESARRKIFRKYKLPGEDKLLLYAPTFRGQFEDYSGVIADDMLEIDICGAVRALEERFGGKWHFALRLHPRLKGARFNDAGLINMTEHPDAEELLLAADALITDYSSVIWDFSFLHRPCFVFARDINDYEVKRGFYIPPEEWPYPIAETNRELTENILSYNAAEQSRKIKMHHKAVGNYERGVSRETVMRLVDRHTGRG